MKNSFYQLVKLAFICCSFVFLTSCSKESSLEHEVDPLLSENELSGLSSYIIPNYSCSDSRIPDVLPNYSDYVDVGNGQQAKTLRTKVFNTDTHIFVEADYIATTDNEDLPGKVTIDIGGTLFDFEDVNPGETVEAKLLIPTEWLNTYVDVNITQKVYLEPAEVHVSLFITEPCPVELGAELKGGLVGYILQPGDEGYVEGETNGLIVSSEDIGESGTMTWPDAMAAAENLELNGYDDWSLPTGTEALNLLNTLSGEFSYDSYYSYGYWTAIEVDETTALRAILQASGLISEPPTIETSPFNKSFQLQVRVVRRF